MMNRGSRWIGRAVSTLSRESGDISSVFPSLSGKKPDPLPPRFAYLKQELIRGYEGAVEVSWQRLLSELHHELDQIKARGNAIVPSINYTHIENGTVPQTFINDLKHCGVGVIRNIVDKSVARNLKYQIEDYIAANKPRVKAFPADNPAVYEVYWSPPQTQARAHPNLLKTHSFLSSLWHSSDPTSQISLTYPLMYADRLRIRQPGDAHFALGPHTDGGSLERWEDSEYRQCYSSILQGRWEDYDPFDAAHRINAKMDLYRGAGACSMFRLFQGWLGLSHTSPGEGTLKVFPSLRLATAYFILRPFFSLNDNDNSSGTIDLSSTAFPGSVPAAGQEYNLQTHPHLQLEFSMTSVPTVEPGDYVVWHCDAIHAVDAQHRGTGDSSVLYIPACALTGPNARVLRQQRQAAESGAPPPDFPGAGGEGTGEGGFVGRTRWDRRRDVEALNMQARMAMGFGPPWEVRDGMSVGERVAVRAANEILYGS